MVEWQTLRLFLRDRSNLAYAPIALEMMNDGFGFKKVNMWGFDNGCNVFIQMDGRAMNT